MTRQYIQGKLSPDVSADAPLDKLDESLDESEDSDSSAHTGAAGAPAAGGAADAVGIAPTRPLALLDEPPMATAPPPDPTCFGTGPSNVPVSTNI